MAYRNVYYIHGIDALIIFIASFVFDIINLLLIFFVSLNKL